MAELDDNTFFSLYVYNRLCTHNGRYRTQIMLTQNAINRKVSAKITRFEALMTDVGKIHSDYDDKAFVQKTLTALDQFQSEFKGNTKRQTMIRNKIMHYMYDLTEEVSSGARLPCFAILKRMVKNVKNNDGTFDHDPLNLAARLTCSLLRRAPVAERYKLLLEIDRKTVDREKYDYHKMIADVADEYRTWQEEQRIEQIELNQLRYAELRQSLLEPQDNLSQIKIYEELLTLVNDQDWSRGRKFAEKKTIYNHLIPLYQAENMLLELHNAEVYREKFIKAGKYSKQAAAAKGYKNSGR